MAHSAPEFVKLNCEKLIGERLPDILVDDRYRTKENALHYDHFLGRIARWKDFDQEIWRCYTDLHEHFQKLEGHNIDVTQLDGDGQPAPLIGIRCGNEISVSGHWDQFCLRPVAMVAQTLDSRAEKDLDLAVEFGSSQVAESSISKCLSPELDQPSAKSGLHRFPFS